MDMRLLGAFAAAPPAAIVRPARRMAMLGLALMALTGFMLFAAEASHVATNGVFQVKAGLIALGILNALLIAGPALAKVADMPARRCLAGAGAAGGRRVAADLGIGGCVRAADRVFLTRSGVAGVYAP